MITHIMQEQHQTFWQVDPFLTNELTRTTTMRSKPNVHHGIYDYLIHAKQSRQ